MLVKKQALGLWQKIGKNEHTLVSEISVSCRIVIRVTVTRPVNVSAPLFSTVVWRGTAGGAHPHFARLAS